MKFGATLFAFLLLAGCNCKKNTVTSLSAIALTDQKCPDKGQCTIELFKNKSILLKSNDFGSQYFELVASESKHTVKYTFSKGDEETMPDSGYREEVVFEIDAANPETSLEGLALQNTNMLFGRFCFCRGATGYYKVSDGNLKIGKDNDKLTVNLNFKITEVPQIIKSIDAVIK